MQLSRAITGILSLCAVTTAYAVPPEFAAQADVIRQQHDADMLQRSQAFMNSGPGAAAPSAGPSAGAGFAPGPAPLAPNPTEDDVGDVDSYGEEVIYLGVQQTESVSLQADCTGVPTDFGACIELPADLSQNTSVDEMDLATFVLPKKSTDSLICFTLTMFSSWSWINTTGASEFASMTVNPTFQIENDELNGLIDPNSGLPFNGQLFPNGPSGLSTFFEFRNLEAGDFEFSAPRLARDCTGGLISQRVLKSVYGLTDKQARDFFKKQETRVTFGVRGNISSVDSANFSYGIRLYGDN